MYGAQYGCFCSFIVVGVVVVVVVVVVVILSSRSSDASIVQGQDTAW
jgi:uncharacterized membrane protein